MSRLDMDWTRSVYHYFHFSFHSSVVPVLTLAGSCDVSGDICLCHHHVTTHQHVITITACDFTVHSCADMNHSCVDI
jgi:hypothetical protein